LGGQSRAAAALGVSTRELHNIQHLIKLWLGLCEKTADSNTKCATIHRTSFKGVRKGGVGLKHSPPLNLLCYKNVITYAKEFVYVFVHFLLVWCQL